MNNGKNKLGIVVRNLTGGGVDRFIYNILNSLNEQSYDKYELWIIYMNKDATFINGKKIYNKSFRNLKKLFIPGNNILFWDYIQLPLVLVNKNFDAVIYPKNHIPLTNTLVKSKKYNIVHDLLDLTPHVSPNRKLNSIYNRIFFKISCEIADGNFAISTSSKKEIMDKLNIPSEKITVIWESVGRKFKKLPSNSDLLSRTQRNLDLPDKFILYIGSDVPRKNLERVAKGFKKIMYDVPHSLVLVGKSVKRLHKRLAKEEKIQWKGYVSEDELVALYNLADLFVFPSLYEGFGLPILEAQACGTPVLTSDVTSCPEVAGDSAHLVDPYSIEDIKNGILKIIQSEDYKKELIEKGLKNIRRFSWHKTVDKILNSINND